MFVAGVTLIASGVCLAVWSVIQFYLGRGSARWPSTPGTIHTAQVRETVVGDDRTRYYVAVSYTYQAEGREYVGTRVHFGHTIAGEERDFAEARARKYAPGRAVTVRYSPDDPQESVLEPAMSTHGLTGMLVWGVILIAFGIVVVQRS